MKFPRADQGIEIVLPVPLAEVPLVGGFWRAL
jgi:hypothetical protein